MRQVGGGDVRFWVGSATRLSDRFGEGFRMPALEIAGLGIGPRTETARARTPGVLPRSGFVLGRIAVTRRTSGQRQFSTQTV